MPPARTRRGGRPTLEEAGRLDRDVREAALRLFLDHGYEGTSVDAIASAAGTTKASVYARFESKEALFDSVLRWAIERSDWPVREPDPPDVDDLEGALTAIATAAVRRAVHPSVVKLSRIAIAHAARLPEVARQTNAAAVWPRQQQVVEVLKHHAATGAIVADEPDVLAEQFLGMVAAAPARLASFGITRDEDALDHHTRTAVELFLRGLRPD